MTTTSRFTLPHTGDGASLAYEPSLAYELRGRGVPVVQLHGLNSSRSREAERGRDLTAEQRGLRVLRYDARGHGESTGTTDPVDYGWPRLADDLLALLDEAMPGEAVHGVGQSMGAATLLTAVVAEPTRFRSLSLAIPPTVWRWRADQSRVYELAARQVERWGGVRWAEITHRPPSSPAQDPGQPALPPVIADECLPAAMRGAAVTDLPSRDDVGRLALPVLLLAWPDDASHPLEVAEDLAELLPDARLEVAHSPADVAGWPELVSRFIRGLSDGAGAARSR